MTQRACFIIAPVDTRLSPLADLVSQAGWRVLNFQSIEPGSLAYPGFLETKIDAADAVIAVLDEPLLPSIMFEVGLALGRNRPLLLVSIKDAGISALEADPILATLPRVRAKLTDRAALRLHVTAFLDSIVKVKERASKPAFEGRSYPLPRKRADAKVRTPAPASLVERHLLEALQSAPEVSAVHHGPQWVEAQDFVPDFAVWLSDDRTIITNPMLIELTHSLLGDMGSKLSQMRRYAVESGVSTVMLVDDEADQSITVLELSPLTYKVGLKNLVQLASRGELLAEMINARNTRVHGLR